MILQPNNCYSFVTIYMKNCYRKGFVCIPIISTSPGKNLCPIWKYNFCIRPSYNMKMNIFAFIYLIQSHITYKEVLYLLTWMKRNMIYLFYLYGQQGNLKNIQFWSVIFHQTCIWFFNDKRKKCKQWAYIRQTFSTQKRNFNERLNVLWYRITILWN